MTILNCFFRGQEWTRNLAFSSQHGREILPASQKEVNSEHDNRATPSAAEAHDTLESSHSYWVHIMGVLSRIKTLSNFNVFNELSLCKTSMSWLTIYHCNKCFLTFVYLLSIYLHHKIHKNVNTSNLLPGRKMSARFAPTFLHCKHRPQDSRMNRRH